MTTRRRTEWFQQAISDGVLSGGSSVILELLDFMDERDIAGSTITRIIGVIYGSPNSTNLDVRLFTGICQITADALASSVSPDPETDEEAGVWLYNDMIFLQGGSTGLVPHGGYRRFDIRSQRKQNAQDRLVLVLQNGAASNSALTYNFLVRTLVKHR